jgi:hypothetical protein
MTRPNQKTSIIICCEEMLEQIGKTVFIDSIQWPHLRNAITGPSLDRCPWCGAEMPWPAQEEDD